MILSAQTIRRYCMENRMIEPFHNRTTVNGRTFGLSSAGYDIRVREPVQIHYGDFLLVSSLERFQMPRDLLGKVCDKSTWAREGLAVQNTVIEPGWTGYLTLELTLHKDGPPIAIDPGDPIAQIVFHQLDHPTIHPYKGKYQDQPPSPVAALREPEDNTHDR